MKELPRSAKTLLLLVHLVALACLFWALFFPRVPPSASPWELALYGALAVLAGARKVRITYRNTVTESGSLSLGFPVIMAAMLRGGPLAGSAIALLSSLSSCLYPRRQKTVQLFFNLSLSVVQSWLAGTVYYRLNGNTLAVDPHRTLLAAVCAALVFFAINSAGVLGIVGLIKGESPFRLWRKSAMDAAPVHLFVAALIALTIVLTHGHVATLLLFGGPIASLVFYSYITTARLAEERQKHLERVEQHAEEVRQLNVRLQRAMAETNHRVKNNLQVVVSLIEMLLRNGGPVSEEEMRRLVLHIRALASMHDLLTFKAKDEQTDESDYLSAREALNRLIPLVQQAAGVDNLEYSIEDLVLPVSKGTSLAVLFNELISNAAKHGHGEIRAVLSAHNGSASLEVADNGPGFPAGFDPRSAANTGLELVESLTRFDLKGELQYVNGPDGGARVVVTFPVDTVRPYATAEDGGNGDREGTQPS